MASDLYVLLDANIIIAAHAHDVWTAILERVTLVAPSTVIREAERYIDPKTGDTIYIHLEGAIQQGKLREVSATTPQLESLLTRFDHIFAQRMDAGEHEALALLLANVLPDHRFCTADEAAIRALSLLDMRDAGISLEEMLRLAGLTQRLEDHYTERFFKEALNRGAQERITGVGLRKPPMTPDKGKSAKRRRK